MIFQSDTQLRLLAYLKKETGVLLTGENVHARAPDFLFGCQLMNCKTEEVNENRIRA